MQFSYFYKPVKNIVPSKNITLEDLYQIVISEDHKARTLALRAIQEINQAKTYKAKNFDYVTPNGTFSQRSDDNLIEASGGFIVDLDHLKNLLLVFQRLMADTILVPVFIFRSPSGDGLKVFLRIDVSLIDLAAPRKKMQCIWEAVNCYFSKHYADIIEPDAKGNFIDPSGSDLSRACFIAHDKDAFFNSNSTVVLGKEFILQYKVEEKKAESKQQNTSSHKKPSHLTTLQDLAARHLLPKDNHHPQLIAFICAANTIDTDIETLLQFIKEHVHISSESAHADPEKLEAEIHDIYNRYPNGSAGVIPLTPLSFAKDILQFKYSKDAKVFVLSGIYYEGVRQYLQNDGFAKRRIGKDIIYVRVINSIISEVTTSEMRDVVTEYVDSFTKDVTFKYKGESYQIPCEAIREAYLKNSNNLFNKSWLEHIQIHNSPILKDTEKEIFFPFKNVVLSVTSDGVTPLAYDALNGLCVWENQLIDHNIEINEDYNDCHFSTFLQNVTENDDDRLKAMISAIGYLIHNYFRASEGQAVILYDEEVTDTNTPQGRTGKGLIAQALKQIRDCQKIDGKHFDSQNKFRWELVTPSTQIVWLDDAKKDFDFSVLHSNITDGWTVERKFRSQITIKPADSPKTLITSNSVIKGGGTTNIGRQFPLELSNHYSKKIIYGHEKPIEDEHNGLFFCKTNWDATEWNKFYCFMACCAGIYLQHGLIPLKSINIERNRFRQATNDDFEKWCEAQQFVVNNRYMTKENYEKFVTLYYGEHNKFQQRTFTNWIKLFAKFKGWDCTIDQSNGLSFFLFTVKRV